MVFNMVNPDISKVDRRFLLALRVTFHSMLDSISIGCSVILCLFMSVLSLLCILLPHACGATVNVQLGAGIMAQFT